MPVVKVHIASKQAEYLLATLPPSIRQAMAQAYRIPESDVRVLISQYGAGCLDGDDNEFLFIEVLAIEGRSKQAKKDLYRRMVDNVSEVAGISPKAVLIMLHELSQDNCGVRGGHMASEIDLGFTVAV